MPLRIIAITTNSDLGLIEENEVLGANDLTKKTLVELGYAKIYDDTKPRVGKSVNTYEQKSYPPDRRVFYNDSIYNSNCTTSATWVPSEWDILVTGKNAV